MDEKGTPVVARVINNLRKNFLSGLVVVTPLVVTFLVLRWLFNAIDGVLSPAFEHIFGYQVPGVGLVALLLLVYLAGLVAASVLGRKAIGLGELMISKLPLISQTYGTARQVLHTLMMSNKGAFKEVVLVEFPSPGMKTLGFVTGRTCDADGQELLTLFIPTAPNPTSGFLQLLPPSNVIPCNISVDEALKMVISGGLVCPATINSAPAAVLAQKEDGGAPL